MSDIFYVFVAITIFCLYFYFDGLQEIESLNDMTSEFNGYVVVNKIDGNHFLKNQITLKKDGLKIKIVCDDIIFMNYAIGDTIK